MQRILPERKTSKNGQVVLIVLLIMSVILVVGLSIASRSVTDIKISQQSQEAARALWVAQAGLEEAIKSNRTIAAGEGKELSGVDYSVTKTGIGAGTEFVFPESVAADKAVTLWLINHDTNGEISSEKFPGGGRLKFYWGNDGTIDGTTPALEATVIYATGGNYRARRYPFDPNSSRGTNFSGAGDISLGCSLRGKSYAFCTTNQITLPGGTPYFVRLKLLFSTNTPLPIAVSGNHDFPQQGNCYESSATIAESGVTRKLRQCQLWSTPPSVFDSVLFSGENIERGL